MIKIDWRGRVITDLDYRRLKLQFKIMDIHDVERCEHYYQISPDDIGRALIYGIRMINEDVVNKYIELQERTKIYRGGDSI